MKVNTLLKQYLLLLISIEKDMVVMRNNRNVLAFGCLNSNEDPIPFAVIDEDKSKIIAIYVDMDYRDLGIETIYDMKELF